MGNKVSSHGAGTVRIMSQNVMCWGDKEARRPLMRRVLTGHGAHFLCLQEVTPTWRGYFEEDLAGYDSVFMYRGAESLEAVPIYWRRDFAELLDSGHFWLSETPEVESYGWGAGCLRIATYGHFRIRETGRELAVVNTHLDWESRSARGVYGLSADLRRSTLIPSFRSFLPEISMRRAARRRSRLLRAFCVTRALRRDVRHMP